MVYPYFCLSHFFSNLRVACKSSLVLSSTNSTVPHPLLLFKTKLFGNCSKSMSSTRSHFPYNLTNISSRPLFLMYSRTLYLSANSVHKDVSDYLNSVPYGISFYRVVWLIFQDYDVPDSSFFVL